MSQREARSGALCSSSPTPEAAYQPGLGSHRLRKQWPTYPATQPPTSPRFTGTRRRWLTHLGVQDLQSLPALKHLGSLCQDQGLPVLVPGHGGLGERVCLTAQNGLVPCPHQEHILGATGGLPEGGGNWGRRPAEGGKAAFSMSTLGLATGEQPTEAHKGHTVDTPTPGYGADPGSYREIQASIPRTCRVTGESLLPSLGLSLLDGGSALTALGCSLHKAGPAWGTNFCGVSTAPVLPVHQCRSPAPAVTAPMTWHSVTA